MTAHALHDAVHRCQTQASALALSFGREERFEDMLQNFGRHAETGVGNLHAGPAAVTTASGDSRGQEICGQGQRATAGHGIAAVHDEIHHDLIQLARIRLDGAKGLIERDPEFDVLAQQAAQHRHHGLHASVEIDRLEGPLAASPKS